MLRSARAALVTAALVATCAACDEADPPDAAPTRTAGTTAAADVRDQLAELYLGDVGDERTDEQLAEADCFAGALLERLDTGALGDAGVIGDDGAVVRVLPVLDVPTAEAWVAAQGECGDFVEVSTRAVVTQSKGKADPTVYAACLREGLDADALEAALVATLTGHFDAPEVAVLSRAQAACSRESQPSD